MKVLRKVRKTRKLKKLLQISLLLSVKKKKSPPNLSNA